MTLILQEIHCLTSKLLVFSYINWLLLTGTVSDPEARTRVTHMRFRQEGPKVHIYYDLEGDGMYLVTLAASEDGGQTFPITPKTVSGDVGDGVEPGRDKHIVWEAVKDVKGLRTDGLVFQVTAWTVTRPVLALGDTTLSFEKVTVGEEHTQILEIGNRGKAALQVWDIQVEGGGFQLVSEPELEVAPGGKGEVMVKFIPLDVGEYEGKLVFQTNDKRHPRGEVILRGIVLTDQGTVPRPELVLLGEDTMFDFGDWWEPRIGGLTGTVLLGEDTMFDFGEVPVGEERTRALWIKSQGDAVLRVQGVQVSEGFYVEGELEWEVAPGEAKGTKVTFAPSRQGAYEGTLILRTNDELHYPEGVILKLRGSGKSREVVVERPKEPLQKIDNQGKIFLGLLVAYALGMLIHWFTH